jgi:NADPH:quinone reductase
LLGQGSTAVGVIDRAGITPGETVLVEAATGGVGSLLVQLARRAGATVLAAAPPERADLALELGAHQVVDLKGPVDGPVQVVLESVGGATTKAALELLEPVTGRMVVYGALSGAPHEIDPETVYTRALSVLGFATALMPPQSLVGLRDRALALGVAGDLRPVIGSVRPLAEAASAHAAMEARQSSGKNVLVP